METGIEPETRNLYESRANVLDQAMYGVDPQKPRNPEDKFKRIDLLDNITLQEVDNVLRKLLEQNGHIIVIDPSVNRQDSRVARYIYIIEKNKLTTVAILSLDHKPYFVRQIDGDFTVALSADQTNPNEVVLDVREGENILKSLSSYPSITFDIGVHKGYISPVLIKETETKGKVWFLNRRVFKQNNEAVQAKL